MTTNFTRLANFFHAYFSRTLSKNDMNRKPLSSLWFNSFCHLTQTLSLHVQHSCLYPVLNTLQKIFDKRKTHQQCSSSSRNKIVSAKIADWEDEGGYSWYHQIWTNTLCTVIELIFFEHSVASKSIEQLSIKSTYVFSFFLVSTIKSLLSANLFSLKRSW